MKSYIKNLEYHFFGTGHLTVDYIRNGEHHHYTFSNVPKMAQTSLNVRKFINK